MVGGHHLHCGSQRFGIASLSVSSTSLGMLKLCINFGSCIYVYAGDCIILCSMTCNEKFCIVVFWWHVSESALVRMISIKVALCIGLVGEVVLSSAKIGLEYDGSLL